MSVAFSSKLSLLRKEKNLTQRQVAEELQISQALLSHYENGIRECNLEFVEKAARYYGVSADYLLGLSDAPVGAAALLWEDAAEADGQLSLQTLLRALTRLHEAAAEHSAQAQAVFLDYFSLCIKKYRGALQMEPQNARALCDLAAQRLLETGFGAAAVPAEEAQPLTTVEARAAAAIRESLSAFLSEM